MDPIRFSIENPVKVTVGVLLTILFGILALTAIPVQLTPNVDQPVITVVTSWVGRSPEEVEKSIIEEQEDKLDSVSNLKKLTATATQGEASLKLEFYVGTNMSRALQEVSDKLREVPDYPADVDQPVITVADGASENAIAWMILQSDDPDFDVESIREQVQDRVEPILERVAGLSAVNVYGGRDREVHVEINPYRLAERGITFNMLSQALQMQNLNVSAGDIKEGRFDVPIRTIGEFDELEAVRETVVATVDGVQIRVRDLGEVKLTLAKRRSFVRSKGERGLAINAIRETGANVIEVMQGLRERIKIVNAEVLPELGPKLKLTQVYDETNYIDDAISLVFNNLFVGASLAAMVLFAFLRIFRPTVIVMLSIPLSVIGTFVVLTAAGRNVNVISLAGLSFAVGMVVDNAIVVLENIDRHLGMGKKPRAAAYDATKEVWGAILASTLTTLVVFVPVIFMQEEAGQLFRDISIAICGAVTLSLIVGVTVIPSASARWLRERRTPRTWLVRNVRSLFGAEKYFGHVNTAFADFMAWCMKPNLLGVLIRVCVILFFTVASLLISWAIAPPTSYLPTGNRNLVFAIMLTPPGYNMDQNETIGRRIEQGLRPYWEADGYDDIAKIPPMMNPMTQQPIENIPAIENYFFVAFNGGIFMGGMSKDDNNVRPLQDVMNVSMGGNPDSFGFAFQPSIFGMGVGGGNAIEIEIVGENLANLRTSASNLFGALGAKYGYYSMQPEPTNFNLSSDELLIEIDHIAAARNGINTASLGQGVRALVDGITIGDYRVDGEAIDMLVVRDPSFEITPDMIEMMPLSVYEADGQPTTLTLRDVARVRRADAAQSILRIEKQRAVRLTLQLPNEVPLQAATEDVLAIAETLREADRAVPGTGIAPGVSVTPAGTAAKLTEVRAALLGEVKPTFAGTLLSLVASRMFLALVVVYLLMAALFESFVYPFVILFAVPLATVGGFIGLYIVHSFDETQQLDVLTMLGFVILIGVVVNNAILIVHQSLNYMRGLGESEADKREALPPIQAIRESIRTRTRPIFMTTATSVFGMMPLVLSGALTRFGVSTAGSELYQGLGSVVVGGLIMATLFTLVVVPMLLSLALDLRIWMARWLKTELPTELAHAS
jgi:HAE1 family hydrophobic/amphiphilic exporter-1